MIDFIFRKLIVNALVLNQGCSGGGGGCFLLEAETQPTTNTISILFDLNLPSNYIFKSLISINLLFQKS